MRRRPGRSGQTMLELVAATTIIAIALVPALRLTSRQVRSTREVELAEMRLSLCTSKLEEELARTVANWDLDPQSGDFSPQGYDELRFEVTKSDAAVDGGIPGGLATVQVTVWHDEDAGADLDPGEQRVRLATKIARLMTYELKSSG